MLLETLALAGIGKVIHDAEKSSKLDAKAMSKYSKAFANSQDASVKLKNKAEYTDKRLQNVVQKKKAVIQYTIPRFSEVYGQIQKVVIENKSDIDKKLLSADTDKISHLRSVSVSSVNGLSDKELLVSYFWGGIGKVMVKESERNLASARNTSRISNVAVSQAHSYMEVYDAIAERADRIAKLLTDMNILFINSINKIEKIIEKNGNNVSSYSKLEKEEMMTCVNIAVGMADILPIPVVDENGQLYEAALEMILCGEEYLEKMKQI